MSFVRFAHISDSHIKPFGDTCLQGRDTHQSARDAVREVNGFLRGADFVMHTGDVTADPGIEAIAPAQEIFAELLFPFRGLPGNHDSPDEIRSLMEAALARHPDPTLRWHEAKEGRMPYVFEIRGHTFAALDAVPEAPFWGARLPTDQLDLVRTLIAQDVPALTIFIHYPVVSTGVPWIDEKMLLWNGGELHELLRRAPLGVVKGVFTGHVHHPFTSVRDGILYSSTASTFNQFRAFPEDLEAEARPEEQPGYAIVDVTPEGTKVSHQRILKE